MDLWLKWIFVLFSELVLFTYVAANSSVAITTATDAPSLSTSAAITTTRVVTSPTTPTIKGGPTPIDNFVTVASSTKNEADDNTSPKNNPSAKTTIVSSTTRSKLSTISSTLTSIRNAAIQAKSSTASIINTPKTLLDGDSTNATKATSIAQTNQLNDSTTASSTALPTTTEKQTSAIDQSESTISSQSTTTIQSDTSTNIQTTPDNATKLNSDVSVVTSPTTTKTTDSYTSTSTPVTKAETTTPAEITTSAATTSTTNNNKQASVDEQTAFEKAFGKNGLSAFIGVCVLCLLLLFLLLVMIYKYIQLKAEVSHQEDELPKLKLLQVKPIDKTQSGHPSNIQNTSSGVTNDGLQTFSLDYEKHVQNKIEEHRRKSVKSDHDTTNMSTFNIGKKPSLTGKVSTGPQSPDSLSSGKPLLEDDEGDDAVVFNFTKKPGESLIPSNLDNGRRTSSVSTAKGAKTTDGKKDFLDSNV